MDIFAETQLATGLALLALVFAGYLVTPGPQAASEPARPRSSSRRPDNHPAETA